MTSFQDIYDSAAERKGGEAALDDLLPDLTPREEVAAMPDDRFLAQMTKNIFRAGFVWKVIENKWPGFEEAFGGFDPNDMAMLFEDRIDRLTQDTRIVRNRSKIETVPHNARFILEVAEEHGSFGKFMAGWPESDQVGLMDLLKKRGARLGGMTGQYFIRFAGKDSFILSKDVVRSLNRAGVVSGNPTSKTDLKAAQDAFNRWHDESGRPYTHLSRILALSVPAEKEMA